MAISDPTSAFLFVVGVWNKIAELTGTLVDKTLTAIRSEASKFSSPPIKAYFWTPALISYLTDQVRIIAQIERIIAKAMEDWRDGVSDIVDSAASGELPLPKHFGSRLMRVDDAWRMSLRLLLSVANEVAGNDRKENETIILEVAQLSRSSSVDDSPEQTTYQKIWASIVRLAVAAATVFLPFAIAYVAAISYLRLWSGDKRPLDEALPQDSRRVSGVSIRRTRKNMRKGPDR